MWHDYCSSLDINRNAMFEVKLKKQVHGFTTDVIYKAESVFMYGEQKVKVHIPNTVVVIILDWDDVEVQ